NNNSSYGRVLDWKYALNIVKENFLGLGIGVGGINMVDYSGSLNLGVIDGFYIKTIIETGIIGLFSLCVFIACSIIGLIQLIHSPKVKNKNYYILVLAIFIGVLVQNFGSNVFDYV